MRHFAKLSFALLACCTFAVASTPWDNNSGVQVYHQANDNSKVAVNEAEQKVLAAKPESSVNSVAPSVPVEIAQNAKDEAAPNDANLPPAAVATNDANTQQLQDQISQLNQNAILLAQSTSNKFVELNTRIADLQQQVKQLDQALLLLNQEIVQVKANAGMPLAQDEIKTAAPDQEAIGHKAGRAEANAVFAWFQDMEDRLGSTGSYILLALLALVIGFVFYDRNAKKAKLKSKPATFAEETDDTRGEYDYMGSEESIPAKLNLARAYIAMEDFASAKKMIAEILVHGNDEQCQEADSLMKEMSQKA